MNAPDGLIEEVSILGAADLEKLQLILDRALRVHARSHFFVWAQGLLQALLPHEVMVCALAGPHADNFMVDVLSGASLPARDDDFLRQPSGGLVEHLARNWTIAGRRPIVYQREPAAGNIDAHLAAVVAPAPFRNFSAHAMCGVGGEIASLFVLINQSDGIGARQVYLLETLLPYLHATWLRVRLSLPRSFVAPGFSREAIALSAREVEVIRWVHAGKSNNEIGILLKISPLTVKNHMQKILRKLNVQNRAQAVVKSLALRVFESSRADPG
jgi:transcriptional regulator EpsA